MASKLEPVRQSIIIDRDKENELQTKELTMFLNRFGHLLNMTAIEKRAGISKTMLNQFLKGKKGLNCLDRVGVIGVMDNLMNEFYHCRHRYFEIAEKAEKGTL